MIFREKYDLCVKGDGITPFDGIRKSHQTSASTGGAGKNSSRI
jgi:hypothetical protein